MTMVLVVDDDYEVRDALADVLADAGYEVASVADGREALEYLGSQAAPDLILLDLMMPHCDGREFRAAQKRHPGLADIPVVALTADKRRGEAFSREESCEVLFKPVDLDRLLETVRRHTGA